MSKRFPDTGLAKAMCSIPYITMDFYLVFFELMFGRDGFIGYHERPDGTIALFLRYYDLVKVSGNRYLALAEHLELK